MPSANKKSALLPSIQRPVDLKVLTMTQLKMLAEELRAEFISIMDQYGGHFAASLGVVEITIALHKVFNAPQDPIVWDIGHQAHIHKLLTGRVELLNQSRNASAPFLHRRESIYDTFGVGHAATSISAALGMAIADPKHQAVAVIGDGALTAGLAYEAMNHAGALRANLTIILNDNGMSISPNVGALESYLNKLSHKKHQNTPETFFSALGIDYMGPVDGHDIEALITVFEQARHKKGPVLVHCISQKGKGYINAEKNPVLYHSVKPGFLKKDSETDQNQNAVSKPIAAPTYSQAFGDWLVKMAAADSRLAAITPAMAEGSGLTAFAAAYPDRFFDVGIAEQQALTFAAGLACKGVKPVVAIYSTFLQRAYDQLIHDIVLQQLPVVIAVDRAGLVGQDGATHHGAFDLSFLSCLPNLTIMAPMNEAECQQMLSTAYALDTPAVVRYPRGSSGGLLADNPLETLPLGKAQILRQGEKLAILAFGPIAQSCQHAADSLNATLVNMRFVKPLDLELINHMAKSYNLLVTVEENAIIGGAGASVAMELTKGQYSGKIGHLGLPDQFVPHGSADQLRIECGLDGEGILAAINGYLEKF